MKEKRRDSKGRILHTGESQRTDGKYLYKYVDAFGNTKYVYAWRLMQIMLKRNASSATAELLFHF